MNSVRVIKMITKDVSRFLGISEEDIFWLQIERGGEFLEEWIGKESPSQIALMKLTPEFWAWWRQHWSGRDRLILKKTSQLDAVELRKTGAAWDYYCRMHSIKCALTPNSVVMEGYHRMLKSITQKPILTH